MTNRWRRRATRSARRTWSLSASASCERGAIRRSPNHGSSWHDSWQRARHGRRSRRTRRTRTSGLPRLRWQGHRRERRGGCDNGPVNVFLPDGTELELEDGATGADAAAAIGEGLARAAIAISIDGGEVRDLARPLPDGAHVSILTSRDHKALDVIRHDAAHVLAAAVMELYPGVKISIGPPIENGFYYDFEFPPDTKVSEDDFARIEQKMREHIKADERFERVDVPVAEA